MLPSLFPHLLSQALRRIDLLAKQALKASKAAVGLTRAGMTFIRRIQDLQGLITIAYRFGMVAAGLSRVYGRYRSAGSHEFFSQAVQ